MSGNQFRTKNYYWGEAVVSGWCKVRFLTCNGPWNFMAPFLWCAMQKRVCWWRKATVLSDYWFRLFLWLLRVRWITVIVSVHSVLTWYCKVLEDEVCVPRELQSFFAGCVRTGHTFRPLTHTMDPLSPDLKEKRRRSSKSKKGPKAVSRKPGFIWLSCSSPSRFTQTRRPFWQERTNERTNLVRELQV